VNVVGKAKRTISAELKDKLEGMPPMVWVNIMQFQKGTHLSFVAEGLFNEYRREHPVATLIDPNNKIGSAHIRT